MMILLRNSLENDNSKQIERISVIENVHEYQEASNQMFKHAQYYYSFTKEYNIDNSE